MTDSAAWRADADLMQRVSEGERAACRRLVEDHLDHMFGLAHRMLDNRAEAEEVTQDAFLKLWRQAGEWRAEARIGTWLYRVVHNLCIDRLRRRKPQVDDDRVWDSLASDDPSPLELREGEQTRAAVNAAIAALPERQRTAITLVYHQELSNKQAAEIMAVSIEALESLLARGRRGLKTHLAPRRAELMDG